MSDLITILKTIRPEADFSQSKNFIEDGLLDSFDVVTLVATLDKNYGDLHPRHRHRAGEFSGPANN